MITLSHKYEATSIRVYNSDKKYHMKRENVWNRDKLKFPI